MSAKGFEHCSHNSCKMWIFWASIRDAGLSKDSGLWPTRIIDDTFGPQDPGRHLDL